MKHLSILFASVVCALLFSACGEKPTEFKSFDLDSVSESRDVLMSELAEDIRILPLETGKDFLVSTERGYWVNDKYIIFFGENAILQFSATDGKFIRTLAIKGGGPNEYDYIIKPVVDDERQILYFGKMSKTELKAIDLNTGNFLPDIPTKETGNLNTSGITDDGMLLIPNDSTFFSYFNPMTGEYTPYFSGEKESVNDGRNVGEITVVGMFSSLSNFRRNRAELFAMKDTLYSVTPEKLVPYCHFTFKDDVGPSEFLGKGTDLSFDYIDNNSILLTLTERRIKVEKSGNNITSIAIRMETKAHYLIDRKTMNPFKIDKFFADYIVKVEKRVNMNSFFRGSDIVAAGIEAIEMLDAIEEALEDGDLTDKQKAELTALRSQLSEDSNPVLLIGKKR